MAARTLDVRSSLLALLPEVRYTLHRVKAHPRAAPYIGPFEALRDEWSGVYMEELALVEAQAEAQALVDAADDGIDEFACCTSKAVLIITRDDRKHDLYKHFFGNKTLGAFKKPRLGRQYAAMCDWLPSLQQSPHAALRDLAPELEALLAIAATALEARAAARQQNRHFRDVGARRAFIDRLNAARKLTYGLLGKLPYEQTGLSPNFADRFFRSEPRRGDADDAEEYGTAASLRALIVERREDLAAAEQQLVDFEAEEVAAQKEADERAATEAALAELDRAAAALDEQRAALREKLSAA